MLIEVSYRGSLAEELVDSLFDPDFYEHQLRSCYRKACWSNPLFRFVIKEETDESRPSEADWDEKLKISIFSQPPSQPPELLWRIAEIFLFHLSRQIPPGKSLLFCFDLTLAPLEETTASHLKFSTVLFSPEN